MVIAELEARQRGLKHTGHPLAALSTKGALCQVQRVELLALAQRIRQQLHACVAEKSVGDIQVLELAAGLHNCRKMLRGSVPHVGKGQAQKAELLTLYQRIAKARGHVQRLVPASTVNLSDRAVVAKVREALRDALAGRRRGSLRSNARKYVGLSA